MSLLTCSPNGRGPDDLHRDSLTWALPDALAAATRPAPSGLGSWLQQLQQERISVLVSLDGSFEISKPTLARYRMHAIACPLPSLRGQPASNLPVATMLSLCGGLMRLLRQGERLALHCDGTLERTALVTSALLLWMGRPLREVTEGARRLQGSDGPCLEHGPFLDRFRVALAEADLANGTWAHRCPPEQCAS